MNLFLTAPYMEKTAAATPLVGRPENWESELLAALYKQAPFLGTYQVHLSIAQESREAGYLLGYFIVAPQMGAPSDPNAPPMPDVASVEQAVLSGDSVGVRIPVVVGRTSSASVIKPFDIMLDMDGKAQPLTEARLSAIMADAGGYEVTTQPIGIENKTYPEPPTTHGRSGGGSGLVLPMDKTAGLLGMALAAASPADIQAFQEKLNDPAVLHGIQHNPVFREAVGRILRTEPAVVEKTAGLGVAPSVVLLEKVAGGFCLSTANHRAYAPVVTHVPHEHSDALPADLRRDAAEHGAVMYAYADPTRDGDLVKEAALVDAHDVNGAGVYLLANAQGADLCCVIPRVHDIELGMPTSAMAVKLAADEGAHSAAVRGSFSALGPARHGTQVKLASWGGTGAVTFVSPELDQATAPVQAALTVRNEATGRVSYTTAAGVVVEKTAGLLAPMRVGGRVHVPETWQAVGVHETLQPTEAGVLKQASLERAGAGGVIVQNYGGSRYDLYGESLVDLPSDECTDLPKSASLLLLGAVGVPLHEAVDVLKTAAAVGRGSCVARRKVQSMGRARSAASSRVASVQGVLKSAQLIKEAAALVTPQAVDAVLSLNFVNADNLESFLTKRPDLEATLRSLCDLLFMCRLGLEDVPEGAVERAVKGLTEVLTGLDAAELRLQAP